LQNKTARREIVKRDRVEPAANRLHPVFCEAIMQPADLQRYIEDHGNARIDGTDPDLRAAVRETLRIKTVLCSQQTTALTSFFAVVALESGKLAAIWENHITLADSLAELTDKDSDGNSPPLNVHEKTLLQYGLHA
jgi:hypothetical protein